MSLCGAYFPFFFSYLPSSQNNFSKRVFGPVCYLEGHSSADYVLKKITQGAGWEKRMWEKKGVI